MTINRRSTLGSLALFFLVLSLVGAGDSGAAPSATLPWPDLGKPAAKSPGGGAKDAALLVAIERYVFLEDKPMTGARRNLNDWQLYLTKTRGVPFENVVLLRDDQATREQILNAAADVATMVQPGGTLWFLFIGHGAPSAGKKAGGVLLGVDTQNDADSLGRRGVSESELLSALGKGKPARTVAILDSCFSGRSSSGSTLVAGLQPIGASRIDAVVATGAVILAAAQGNEFAGPLPGGNRPAFSYLMLAALRGWGDSNGDGKVTVSEAAQYARRALQSLLVGRHQTPEIAGQADNVAVASAGESGPDLGDWQRMMPSAVPPPEAVRSFSSDVDVFKRRGPARPADFALIVGIERYETLPKADFGERDAEVFRRYVLGLGVPEENVILLLGPKATKTGMMKYIEEWLPRNVTADSRVFVFYSGHGASDPAIGAAYLVPYDGDPTFLQSSAYPVPRLLERLEALKAKETVVALDACFSGAGGRSVITKGARPLVVTTAMVNTSPKVSVLAASSSDEISGSLDEQGHGLFTYYLLKGLQGAADADGNGHVSLEELHAYVKKSVQREARRQNREQTPNLQSATPGLTLY